MFLFCTLSDIFNVVPLRSGLGSLRMAPFDKLHTSSYWRSTVTFAISCIVSEIKWHIGRKSLFYRAMLSTAWTMPSQDVRPSVCHTLVFCRNGWKYILKLFTRSGSHTILVFPHQTVWKYSDRDPKRGRRMQKIWKNRDFWPIFRFISETINIIKIEP